MRFLKSQYVSKYSPNDNTVRVNSYGRGVMDFNGAVMIPKGTTAQRPQLTGVRHPIDGNGYIRYNIDNDAVTGQPIGIEAYVGGAWQVVRGPAVGAVSIETLGPRRYRNSVWSIIKSSCKCKQYYCACRKRNADTYNKLYIRTECRRKSCRTGQPIC